MKIWIISILMLSLIVLSACTGTNTYNASYNGELYNEDLSADLNETDEIVKKIDVKNILNTFEDWEGSKDIGEYIYTLNYNDDTYILTICSDRISKTRISWVDLFYFKDLEDSYSINEDELEPLGRVFDFFKLDSDKLKNKIIEGELPYGEVYHDWKISIDYYTYQDKKQGIYFKIISMDDYIYRDESIDNSGSLNSKRQDFSNAILNALSPVCDKAYFNSKGEFILEVNSDWYSVDEEIKKDIIYSIENQLREVKDDLKVEGFGQFFSNAGRPLESFYAD